MTTVRALLTSLLACIGIAGCARDLPFASIDGEPPQATQQRYLDWSAQRPGWSVTPSGLRYHRIGAAHLNGDVPKPDSVVTVQCEGHFIDGRLFFGTTPGKPLTGPLTRLIKGWQEGLLRMHTGETWEFVLPSALAYGAKGWTSPSLAIPSIPPDTVLLFKIELIGVTAPEPTPDRTAP